MTHDQAGETPVRFRKSSYSASGNGSCVEVGDAGVGVAVRDSKNPAGPVLGFAVSGWRAFAAGAARPRS